MRVQINGKHIEWKQLWQIYNKQAKLSLKSKGICFDRKLKLEDKKLTSYSRMSLAETVHIIIYMPVLIVIYIIQVLSNTVTDLFSYYEDPSMAETQRFVHIFDKLFNVRDSAKKKLKTDLKPWSDERLEVRKLFP